MSVLNYLTFRYENLEDMGKHFLSDCASFGIDDKCKLDAEVKSDNKECGEVIVIVKHIKPLWAEHPPLEN